MQIVLRVLVILLALLGIGGALLIAIGLHFILAGAEMTIPPSLGVSSMEEAIKRAETGPALQVPNEMAATLPRALEAYPRNRKGVWFLDAVGPLGLFAIILCLFGKGKCAAALLLVAFVGPVVIMPVDDRFGIILFTGALPVAGLLAFFIRSTQRPPLAGSEA